MKTKKLFGNHNSTVIVMTSVATLVVLATCLVSRYLLNVNLFTPYILLVLGGVLLTICLTVIAYNKRNEYQEKIDSTNIKHLHNFLHEEDESKKKEILNDFLNKK